LEAKQAAHLKPMPEGFDDPVLREFLEEDVCGGSEAPAQPASTYEAPGEYRQRSVGERPAVGERHVPKVDGDL
jgi:hypothetical protein